MMPERRIWRQDKGAALVEFALVASLLVLMMLPIVDVGMGFYYKTRVMTAAEAGAQYAFAKGWSNNYNSSPQTNICNAVITATGLGNSNNCSGATNTSGTDILVYSANPNTNDPALGVPNFTLACYCVNSATFAYVAPSPGPSGSWAPSDCTGRPASDCTAVSGQNQSPAAYVTVRTRYTYQPLFGYLTGGNSISLSATSTVRIP